MSSAKSKKEKELLRRERLRERRELAAVVHEKIVQSKYSGSGGGGGGHPHPVVSHLRRLASASGGGVGHGVGDDVVVEKEQLYQHGNPLPDGGKTEPREGVLPMKKENEEEKKVQEEEEDTSLLGLRSLLSNLVPDSNTSNRNNEEGDNENNPMAASELPSSLNSASGLASKLKAGIWNAIRTENNSTGIPHSSSSLQKEEKGDEGSSSEWREGFIGKENGIRTRNIGKEEDNEAKEEEEEEEEGGGSTGSGGGYVLEPLSDGAAKFLGLSGGNRNNNNKDAAAARAEEEEGEGHPFHASSSSSTLSKHQKGGNDEEEDRLVLPNIFSSSSSSGAAGSTSSHAGGGKKGGGGNSARRRAVPSRKATKMSWEKLKLVVLHRFGAEGLDVVEAADGNAADPLFTVTMKVLHRRGVPVPSHWDRLRPFLSHQADREAAAVVPLRVQRLGVSQLRASREKYNPHNGGAGAGGVVDHVAFMSCFLTGTPLQRYGFGVGGPPYLCSTVGDVFWEGKWYPPPSLAGVGGGGTSSTSGEDGGGNGQMTPGALSTSLREALGMSAASPPPWLYAMQDLRRLPPAYPEMWIPGLNAPIPVGAQWGKGVGQWGQPPRGADQNFLFPGVMDEAVAVGSTTTNTTTSSSTSSSSSGAGHTKGARQQTHEYLQKKGVWGRVPALVPPTPEEARRITAEHEAATKRLKKEQQQQDRKEGGEEEEKSGGGARPRAALAGTATITKTGGGIPSMITPMPFLPKTFAQAQAPLQGGRGGGGEGGGAGGVLLPTPSGPLEREYVQVMPGGAGAGWIGSLPTAMTSTAGGGTGSSYKMHMMASRNTIAVGATLVPKPPSPPPPPPPPSR